MKSSIVVGFSPELKIRGVVANKHFRVGELIERAPLIIYKNSCEDLINNTPFGSYVYRWDDNYDCLPLGYGVLYNHSYKPNAIYKRDYKKKVINFLAIKNIKKGEEITINYNGEPNSKELLDEEFINFDKHLITS